MTTVSIDCDGESYAYTGQYIELMNDATAKAVRFYVLVVDGFRYISDRFKELAQIYIEQCVAENLDFANTADVEEVIEARKILAKHDFLGIEESEKHPHTAACAV
jgi:hypothetical protein